MLLKIIKSSEMASKRTAGRGFRKRKGRLSWPISGSVAIPYGSQRDPKFKTPVFRNGIYVSAPDDAVVRAAHKGKVVFADWFKGYGQLIILNHGGGYHTLYANLSEIFLKTGDIIEERAKMGRVGSSGLLNRPSLYFEIRYKGKTLDPTQWLEKKIARSRK
jgi:septal ring factor EnvC (AmiA/AmiB activator)